MATNHKRGEELIDLTPEDEEILDRIWAKFRRNHPRPSPEYIAGMERAAEASKRRVRPSAAERAKRFAELERNPYEVRR
jgi:hypothetical protein